MSSLTSQLLFSSSSWDLMDLPKGQFLVSFGVGWGGDAVLLGLWESTYYTESKSKIKEN